MKNVSVLVFFPFLLFGCKDSSTNSSPSGQLITAAQRIAAVSAFAIANNSRLRLLSVSTQSIGSDGKASSWSYSYLDTSIGLPMCYFHATAIDIALDSTSPPLIGSGVINLRWFNSDSAMIFAERNGGSQYRTQNPGWTASASLGQSLSPPPVVSWWIVYRSSSIALGLQIDAKTGALIGQTR
jgi:hypothetical protein